MLTKQAEIETTETDVLIIGGGSAGCMAAIAAYDADPKLKVTILEKAHTQRSGTLATGMDAMNVVAVPGLSTPEDYVKGVDIDHAHGIIDEELHYVLAEKSFAMIKKLEEWGVGFEKDDDGQYVGTPVFYGDIPGDKFCIPMAGLDLKLILNKEVKKRNIKVYNHTITTSLLSDNEKVYGACGFNIRTGKFIACSAKAVILASGGCGRFGIPSSGYMYGTFDFPGNAGDGYSMAYRAGARMRNFEYAQHFCETKRLNVPLGKEYDKENNTILVNEMGENVSVHAGSDEDNLKVLLDGQTLYEKFSHLSEETIKEVEKIWFESERKHPIISFFKERGMDIRKDDVELGFEDIALCSGHGSTGIEVGTDTSTSVKGLFACGDVACVPSQYLTGAFVYGEISGLSAVEYAKKCDFKKIGQETIKNQAEMVYAHIERADGITPKDFEFKLRTIITEYLTPPRSAEKLKTALMWFKRFREEDIDRLKPEDWHELSKAVEARFILDCAEMTATSALKREETRWGVSDYRSDFPKRDDKNWLKFIDLQLEQKTGEMIVSTSPIKRRENKEEK
jgi:succinate dehydrogenase/fumarate reductase flavoprotein subunit